jgi:ectoine hydroxylase-related dioxygenase (phytanoyl-CoA dioxygenase family)
MPKLLPDTPIFESARLEEALKQARNAQEREFLETMARDGGAVIDLGALGRRLCDQVAAETNPFFDDGKTARVQDAWIRAAAVRRMARLPQIRRMLRLAYGRRAFPFQSLNFLQGSQQHLHSDTVHFSSQPERFMCGVWIALEDVRPESGPVIYKVGSHAMPILKMRDVGVNADSPTVEDYSRHYVPRFAELMEASDCETRPALLRKGQAFVWAANLAHGGSPIQDPASTRRSLVLHYYFEDCTYYTPMFSDEARGALFLREPADISAEHWALRWPLQQGRWVGWRSPEAREGLRARKGRQPILN